MLDDVSDQWDLSAIEVLQYTIPVPCSEWVPKCLWTLDNWVGTNTTIMLKHSEKTFVYTKKSTVFH